MPQVDFASKLSKPVGTFSQRIVSDLPPPRKWRIQKFKRHRFDFSIIKHDFCCCLRMIEFTFFFFGSDIGEAGTDSGESCGG